MVVLLVLVWTLAAVVIAAVVTAEVRGSAWFQAFKVGRSVQQADLVLHQAAEEMRQTAEQRSVRRPQPSWQDW
jgi:biopolymer transport protein ExbB/TolQ